MQLGLGTLKALPSELYSDVALAQILNLQEFVDLGAHSDTQGGLQGRRDDCS